MNKISEDSFPFKYLLYFFAVTFAISIAGYLIYNDRKNAIEDELYRHVGTIKEIKLSQISKEQLQRKKAITSMLLLPEVKNDVKTLFTKKMSPLLYSNINKWANEIKNDFEFVSLNIFNKNADLLFSTDSSKSIYDHYLKHELVVLLQKDSSALSNLYLAENKKLLQAIITPIKNGSVIVGYLWTEVSFFEYLHPIISYTKQETEDVEYILLKKQSDLGFILRDIKENDEFKIRTIPISKEDKTELESFIKGKDFFKDAKFKGSKIFASVNEIPGTDWILLANINQEKVAESTKNAAMLITIISFLLIVLSASITYAIWKRSRLHFLTRTFTLRKEKDALTERYTSLTKYANDMILSIDKNGKILEANQKAFNTYGYTKDELLKMDLLDLSYDRKKDIEVIFASINNPEGILFETNHKRKNGTIIPVEISAKLIKQGDEEILLAIVRDNTERKKLELDLILAKDKAEEMDRLKTTFLSNMSHELNTPMSGIIGFSELLLSEMDNKNHREMAKIIHKSGKRLNETLNSILDLSKIQSQKLDLRLSNIELLTMMQECKYAFSDAVNKKGLRFSITSDQEKVFINTDQNILHKILCNIVDNAIKYTNEGEVRINLNETEENIIIKITDTGIGIPKENLDQIFEPFRQGSEGLNRKFEGMGLGLTITKKYVEILGGALKIQSEPGIGTTIELVFRKK
ncbi:MAG: PAS domain-containing sensor histidine kinase [Ignavibacteriales bacterium]|nr:PAS domain-containing sensor histidine kinase [Ignavibacteriales bacterium]